MRANVKSSRITGLLLIALGLAILFLLRGALVHLIITLLEILGVVVGVLILIAGIALIFWRRR